MNSEVTVRTATTSDIEKLLAFEQGVIAAERPFDPTLKEGHIHYYDINDMIGDPAVELVVAEAETGIVGCGYARIRNSKHYLQHRQHAYLGFMYVDPAYRGLGINHRIIEELKKWSRSRNMTELRLEVYYNNEPAIRAYEKSGFNRHMIEMRMGI